MDLSPAATRFLSLHHGLVERCQAVFGGAMIRCTTSEGQTATVRLDEVDELVVGGLLRQSWGGLFELTELGRSQA